MIEEVKMYVVRCDRCQEVFDSRYSYCHAWANAKKAIKMAIEEGWTETKGAHYCPICYEYIQKYKPNQK